MIHNFTSWDLEATSVAFVLFALFTVIPGYVLGALLNVFVFNRRTLAARIAISICLSVAVVPITVYLNWRSAPVIPWVVCGAAWLAFPVIVLQRLRRRPPPKPLSRQRIIVLAILAGWVVVGTLCLIDIQIGRRLYFPITSYDYTLRAAFTAAINRSGVPPPNPYFFPGHAYTLRYHYFWYMLCGLVERFGGSSVTARIAVIGGTLWSGIGLVAVVTLYVHLLRSKTTGNPDKQMLAAVALLSVAGLDILPVAIIFCLSGKFNASSAWWNEPVLFWVDSVFWQPHSVAALTACATGLLVLSDASRHSDKRLWLSSVALGGAALASGLGLSVYVTFVFGVFLMVWVTWLLVAARVRQAMVICAAGAVAIAMSVPYLLELLGPGSGGKPPIGFAIRSFYIAEALLDGYGFGKGWQTSLVNLLTLPLNYFVEFGFFFVVGVRKWRNIRRHGRSPLNVTGEDAFGIAMVATSILIGSFLRSNTILNNDLGWRALIVAQFVLLLWAAELWGKGLFPSRKSRFSAVGVTIALGVAATVYDVAMLRIYPILLDDLAIPRYHWLAADHHLGDRAYALRQVYEALDRQLPRQAIVQQNPNATPGDLFYGLYADRQTAAGTLSCGVVFGGSAALCSGILDPIRDLFDRSGNSNSAQVDVTCRKLSIDALVVKDTDGVWNNKASWVWTREPLIANAYSRAFLCGARK